MTARNCFEKSEQVEGREGDLGGVDGDDDGGGPQLRRRVFKQSELGRVQRGPTS